MFIFSIFQIQIGKWNFSMKVLHFIPNMFLLVHNLSLATVSRCWRSEYETFLIQFVAPHTFILLNTPFSLITRQYNRKVRKLLDP